MLGKEKRNNKRISARKLGNFFFMWLPTIIGISLCAFVLFPWNELLSGKMNFFNLLSDKFSLIAILFVSYTIIIAKNNYDVNHNINNKIDEIPEKNKNIIKDILEQSTKEIIEEINTVDADDLFVVRDDLEPISSIYENASCVRFTGGHLSSVIVTNGTLLKDFLNKKNTVYFLMPNPMNKHVMEQYANKLMIDQTPEDFKELVFVSLKTIYKFKTEKNYNVEIRVYEELPAFGLQIIETPKNSRINVELYTLKTELSERLSFPIKKSTSGEMYNRFLEQFNILWEQSSELEDIDGLVKEIKRKLD